GAPLSSAVRRDRAGKAMRGAAQASAGDQPHAPPQQPDEFGLGGRPGRGQHVGGIVDEDPNFETVDRRGAWHRRPYPGSASASNNRSAISECASVPPARTAAAMKAASASSYLVTPCSRAWRVWTSMQ